MQDSPSIHSRTNNGLKLFRPSSGSALELCSHFEAMVTPSPNKVRGSNFHLAIAEILKAKKEEREIRPEMANGFSVECDWALQTADQKLHGPIAIEEEVQLWNGKEFITSGTLDLLGWSNLKHPFPIPGIIDWKTGQERDYWAQLSIYGLTVLEGPDMEGMDEIDLTVAFVDQERAFTQTFSRDELRTRVNAIIEALRDPASPYYINPYCGYCDLRGECPAWAAERSLVGSLFDKDLSLQERFSVLKQDPEKLGRFVVAWRRLKNMVEKTEQLDQVALGMIQSGATMSGLTTIKRKGNESIEPSALVDLIRTVKSSQLDEFLSVDVKAARELWDKYMHRDLSPIPFPETEISKATEYLALKK